MTGQPTQFFFGAGRPEPTSKADEYRGKARECEEGAEHTRDSFIKEQILEVAKKWQEMADYEEKRWGW